MTAAPLDGHPAEPEDRLVVLGIAAVVLATVAALAVAGVVLMDAAGVHLGWAAVVAGVAVCAVTLLVLVVQDSRQARRAPSSVGGAAERWIVAPVVAVAVIATVVGIGVSFTPLLTLPVLGVFGLALAVGVVLWFVDHFPAGLLILFVIRPALDEFKVGGGGAATFADPSIVSGVVFLAAAALWFLRRHRSGQPMRLSRSSAGFAALAVVCVLSSLTASDPITSVQASVRVLASAVMFIVLEEVLRDAPGRLRPLLVALFASLALPAVFAAFQLAGSVPEQPLYGPAIEVGRIQGTFVHPNAFATYLVVLIPLALAVFPHVSRWAKVALVASTLTSSFLLLFTYARAAWLAALLGVLIVGWLQDRRVITSVIVGVLVLVLAVPSVSTRIGELGEGRDELTDDPNSLVWRMEYWGRVLPSVEESPITGIGLGMVQHEQPERLPPHNVFVQAAAETGIAGLAALLFLIAALALELRRALHRARTGLHRGVVIGAIGISAGFLAQCLSENLLNQPVSHWYLLVPVAWATTHTGRAPWVIGGRRPALLPGDREDAGTRAPVGARP